MTSHKDQEGAAALELAATLPVLLLLFWGVLTYGLFFAFEHQVNEATAGAARDAVSARTETDAISVAQSSVDQRLGAFSGLVDPASVTVTVADCPTLPGVRCITVAVDHDYRARPVVPAIVTSALPERVDSTSVVQLSL